MEETLNVPEVAQEPDWAGIRAAAVIVGIRAACRQATDHLPPEEARRFTERAMKRCSREGWLVTADKVRTIDASASPQRLSANVRTGAEIAENTLESLGKRTRVGLAKAVATGSDHVATLDGPEVLASARNIKELAGTASILHGWTSEQPIVRINVMQRLDEKVVEGDVIDI